MTEWLFELEKRVVMPFGQQVERRNELAETKASAVLVGFEMCEMAMRVQRQLGIEALPGFQLLREVVMGRQLVFVLMEEMSMLAAGQ